MHHSLPRHRVERRQYVCLDLGGNVHRHGFGGHLQERHLDLTLPIQELSALGTRVQVLGCIQWERAYRPASPGDFNPSFAIFFAIHWQ